MDTIGVSHRGLSYAKMVGTISSSAKHFKPSDVVHTNEIYVP